MKKYLLVLCKSFHCMLYYIYVDKSCLDIHTFLLLLLAITV